MTADAQPFYPVDDGTSPAVVQSSSEDEDEDNCHAYESMEHFVESHCMGVYCKECQTWLNGPRQWEDHRIGKKHRKNVFKARRGTATSSVESVPVGHREPTQDKPPEKPNRHWYWLEQGKENKIAAQLYVSLLTTKIAKAKWHQRDGDNTRK